MKEIRAQEITKAVAEICQQANYVLGDDVLTALKEAHQKEVSLLARYALEKIIQNGAVAKQQDLPLCQDCGTAIIFLEVGQDVHVTKGDINQAVAEGVCQGYGRGYLRKSMVNNPLSSRINTGDNTPPVLHTKIVPGNQLKITVMPKGGGAENMSRLTMLKPGVGNEGIVDVVVKTIDEAGGNPCPPLIIGLGIGGTADKAMLLAKEALLRKLGAFNTDPEVARLENDILDRVNDLGIGALGLGGSITALAVHAEVFPAHIASLPVAINLQCHSARHREVIL
jgi:fumarate hydratase subunit alpha